MLARVGAALQNAEVLHSSKRLGPWALILVTAMAWPLVAGDQPQWGRAWDRNLVSTETNLPASFNPDTGENVRWAADLGTESYSTPVVAGGRVYIGTNNGQPRDPRHQGDRGVLMCFDEKDGHLLWQLVVPKRVEDPFFDWPKSGISSPVTVEGDRVYLVSNRGEVLCLDPQGLANGNDGPFREEAKAQSPTPEPIDTGPLDADILWKFDLTAGAGIWSHDAAHSSILILGDHLYLNTGTGVDNTHKRIRTPEAPGLVVLDKRTGRLLARDRERTAPETFHCTWSAPSLANVGGEQRVFFAAGNGWVYGFAPLAKDFSLEPGAEPVSLRCVWRYDFDPGAPKEHVHRFNSNRRESPSNFYGMPVVVDDRLYVAGGGDVFWGKNEAWVKCVSLAGTGDVTAQATRWSYALEKHTLATPAVHQGLVYVTDAGKRVHCVEAATGQVVWTHDSQHEFWASPMVVDGKVMVGNRGGQFLVFAAGREKQLLAEVNVHAPVSATVTPANGCYYVATMNRLFAVGKPGPRP